MPCHCRSRHVGEAAVGAARCRGARAKTIAFKGNAQAELDTATVTDATKSSGPLSLVIGAETWGAKDRYVGLDKRVFLSWAALVWRVFGEDPWRCRHCGGPMRFKGVVEGPVGPVAVQVWLRGRPPPAGVAVA